MSKAKVKALRQVLADRDPFCSGVCPVPEYQFRLYYAQGTLLNRLNFAHATTEELEALFRACQPASVAYNNEDLLDRKAVKMNRDTFATLFDPRNLGIHDVIERDLLSTDQGVELELRNLNVHGKDGFFKAHQDTPRGDSIFGTLVVVLPAPHEGGQLSLRLDDRHWIVDFKEQFSVAMEPSICFVAFFGEVEHQVLPITSGYRVTLTYNLHFRAKNNIPRAISSPFHERLKEKLVELVNDTETLPNGGYLKIGLCHEYAYDEAKPIDSLLDQLKGKDAAVTNVCKDLGLPCSLKLFYAGCGAYTPDFLLLSRARLDPHHAPHCREGSCYECGKGYVPDYEHMFLRDAVKKFAPGDLEGVCITGKEPELDPQYYEDEEDGQDFHFMKKFYKDPVPQMLEVKKLSSVHCETVYACIPHKAPATERYYGKACMMISVKPKELRDRLGF